jgi:membrane protease YdiL (CAAX protease family)
MTAIRSAIGRHPIVAYIAIAFAFSWAFTLASSVSIAFALVALFGPAVAAIVVTRAEGTGAELKSRITGWRQPLGWYALALGIPFAVAGVARVIYDLTGTPINGLGTISAIEVLIFVLVIGEEIGWRGFLQPRLREHHGLAVAGLLTGVVWVLWHLPVYLSPQQGPTAFLMFAFWVLPLSVAMGAVAEGARFSVIVATVMHGAANIATPILLPSVDRAWWLLVTGVLYAVVAAGLVYAAHRRSADLPLVARTAGA